MVDYPHTDFWGGGGGGGGKGLEFRFIGLQYTVFSFKGLYLKKNKRLDGDRNIRASSKSSLQHLSKN